MTNLTIIEGGEGNDLTAEEQAHFDRAAYVQGLHDIADFLEEHPNIPLPEKTLNVFTFPKRETVDTLRSVAKELGTFEKKTDSSFIYVLSKAFGPLNLDLVFARSNVCTKTVVGVKKVMKRLPPEGTVYLDREVDEEIIEWKCPALLDVETGEKD